MSGSNSSNNAQKALQNNLGLRNLLLASAPRMRKDLGTYVGVLGQTTRVQLFNVGIITSLQLYVSFPVTIGVAIAAPSPRAPYNIISRVRVTDYDGTDRVNLSGFQLFVLNCVRNRNPYGVNNSGPIVTAGGSSVLGGVITNPSLPTAIGNGTVSFLLDIPLAYDPETDLRGAILGQTAVGAMYLSVDWASSLYTNTNLDALYYGAGTTTVAFNGVTGPSLQVWQEYLLPQSLGGTLPLPVVDLQTVYELAGNVRDNANLSAGTTKLVNLPNVRSVIGAYITYMNGTQQNGGTDISLFSLIANGNNILRQDTSFSQLVRQRNYLEGDIAYGQYFFLYRSKPMETALFGNVQIGIVPSVVNTNALIEIGFESFYTKGSALPGMVQN